MNTLPRKCIGSVLSCYFFVSTSKTCIFIFVVKLLFASIYGELLLLERFKTVTNLHNHIQSSLNLSLVAGTLQRPIGSIGKNLNVIVNQFLKQ